MKTGTLHTQVPCDSAYKAAPAFAHLLKQAGCGGLAVCDGPKDRMKIAYVCMDGKSFRRLDRAVKQEVGLLKRHRLAGRKKK